jgi:hypothetical protein
MQNRREKLLSNMTKEKGLAAPEGAAEEVHE